MIDFHCHLDLFKNPTAVVEECVRRNLYVLSVTTTPSAWSGTSALAARATRIRTALGIHPQLAHERMHELDLFEQLLPQTRYVGEIGLDGSPELRPHWDAQKNVFDRILQLCRSAGGKILSIHSRRGAGDVLDHLEKHAVAGDAVLHWFSGTQKELKRAIDLGCWFSAGPAMLNGDKGRQIAAAIPRDRLLTESDGPFAQLNGEPLMPWSVEMAVGRLSELWGAPAPMVQHQLSQNLKDLVTKKA